MNTPNDKPVSPWEDKLNAWLDDELSEAEVAQLELAALKDAELSRAYQAARQLKRSLGAIPRQQAPRRLRRKLLAIPGARWGLSGSQWSWLRRGALIACIPLVLVVANLGDPRQPSVAEIHQGQQDLALAMSYLSRASQKAGYEINHRLSHAMLEPVADSTVDKLGEQLNLPKEYLL